MLPAGRVAARKRHGLMQSGRRLERQVSLDQDAELVGQLIERRDVDGLQAPGPELAVASGRFDNGDRFSQPGA